MIIKGCAATDVGKKRRNNEDNFYICGRYKEDPDANVDHAGSNQSVNLINHLNPYLSEVYLQPSYRTDK